MNTTLQSESSPLNVEATSFDDAFEAIPATRRVRRKVWSIFHRYFKADDSVLDLNCRVGTDVLELASKGIHVHGIDPSADMIAALRRKLRQTALHSFVTPMQLPLQQLRTLGNKRFDGAYSNFGGLNCAIKLNQVAFDLTLLVKPGGYLVLSIMPRFSFWESAASILTLRWNKAFRRRHVRGVLGDHWGEKVWLHYYTPREIKNMFRSNFDFVEMTGLNIFSPPPSAKTAHKLLGKGAQFLEAIDNVVPKNSFLQGWGDHYIVVFKRKSE